MFLVASMCFIIQPQSPDPLYLLARMEGAWKVQYTQIQPDGSYLEVGTSQAVFRVALDGKLVIEETVVHTAHRPFPILIQYSYDAARGVYRKSSTDAVSGNMDIQEGLMSNGKLHLTNTKYETWFVGSSGQDVAFSLVLDFVNQDEMILNAQLSANHGETWDDFQKVYYRRIPDS